MEQKAVRVKKNDKKHYMRVSLYKKGNISPYEFSVSFLHHASVFYNGTKMGSRGEEKYCMLLG